MRLVLPLVLFLLSAPAGAFDLNDLNAKISDLNQQTASNGNSSQASGLAQFTEREQIESLRQALTQGAETAVSNLARENGYLGNDNVRIPLPDNLQKADRTMRKFG